MKMMIYEATDPDSGDGNPQQNPLRKIKAELLLSVGGKNHVALKFQVTLLGLGMEGKLIYLEFGFWYNVIIQTHTRAIY